MLYTITLGYCPSRIWRLSADAYYKNAQRETQHVFVDHHYPLNKDQNRKELREICAQYKINVLDPGRNLGGVAGFNWALKQLPLKAGDVVLGYDPDSRPISLGFDGALQDVILLDQKINWASLMSDRSEPELNQRGYVKRMVNQIEVWRTVRPVVNSICAFRAEWLLNIGGLWQNSPLYGGLEIDTFPHLRGGEWVFLPGWRETDDFRNLQDTEYLHWKWCYAHLREFKGDFAEYISAGCPKPSDLPERLP